MIRKRFIIAAVLVAVSLSSAIIFLWAFTLPPNIVVPMGIEELRIVQIGWNVPLARAEFNLTARDVYPHVSIDLAHVEVDGKRVDAYPQTLSPELGQSAIIKVYYNYAYDSRYKFSFITEKGNKFPYASQSPPE